MNEEQIKDINEEFADMAEAIAKIAALGEVIDNSPLKKSTITLLLSKKTGLPVYQVKQVLDAIPALQSYLK